MSLKRDWITLSFYSLIALFLIYPIFTGFPMGILAWDNFGYYLYLPQTFIYHDLQLADWNHLTAINDTYNIAPQIYQVHLVENGNRVIQYSCGQSILQLPFFLGGHLVASVTDYPADGFSRPYVWAILVSNYFYMILGLVFTRKSLLHFFQPKTVLIAMALLCLGTNYFIIHMRSQGMPHVYLFALYAILIWLTIKWHARPNCKTAVYLGLTFGLMIICRPTEIVAVLIPLLYGVYSWRSFGFKMKELVQKHRSSLFVIVGIAFVLGFIQLLYWKHVTGEWLYNSYANPAEGLELLHPHVFEFLFSFRKGWLIYTPMVIIAIIGFVKMNGRAKSKLFWSMLIFLIAYIYISSCWSKWWYAASFSQRTMTQAYIVLAFLFGVVVEWRPVRAYVKPTVYTLAGFFLLLNVFQSWQYTAGILAQDRMTLGYYLAAFGKTQRLKDTEELLHMNRLRTDFKEDEHNLRHRIMLAEPNKTEYLSTEFSPAIRLDYWEITDHDYAWIKVEMDVFVELEQDASEIYLTSTFINREKQYGANMVALSSFDSFEENKWIRYSYYYLTPEIRLPSDEFRSYLWNRGQEVRYRNHSISIYEPKKQYYAKRLFSKDFLH